MRMRAIHERCQWCTAKWGEWFIKLTRMWWLEFVGSLQEMEWGTSNEDSKYGRKGQRSSTSMNQLQKSRKHPLGKIPYFIDPKAIIKLTPSLSTIFEYHPIHGQLHNLIQQLLGVNPQRQLSNVPARPRTIYHQRHPIGQRLPSISHHYSQPYCNTPHNQLHHWTLTRQGTGEQWKSGGQESHGCWGILERLFGVDGRVFCHWRWMRCDARLVLSGSRVGWTGVRKHKKTVGSERVLSMDRKMTMWEFHRN